MCKNKILEKLLAIILIFTLTFANFAFVTECFASSMLETLFGDNSSTGNKNVEFEAYFGTEDEKENSVVSDVNRGDLSINMIISVLKEGYLKNAKVEILEAEEGKGINFKVSNMENLSEYVQSFEENTLSFRQIDNSSKINFELPIEYVNEDYVDDSNLSKDAIIRFTGTYVESDGDEKEVSKDIKLNVSWKDEREVNVQSQVAKYIDYGKGVILQTVVKVDSQTEGKSLPVKSTDVLVNVPSLNGIYPTKVSVVANTTEGTNGKTAGDVVFDESNWKYDEENKTVEISVENSKEPVEIVENPNEFVKEDLEPVIEDRYYSKSGVDEYLLTYTYENTALKENMETSSEISAKLTTFSGVEKDENKNIVSKTNVEKYILDGQTGNIVSLNIENTTPEVSKAYMYVNYNHNDKYETEYQTKSIINVSYKDIVKNIFVEDVENFYTGKDGSQISTEDMYYKRLVISKENMINILGENGEIKISDLNGNEIATINNTAQEDENGNININIENKISKLKFEISAPINEGNLVISKVKASKNSSLDKETLKNIESIGSMQKISASYTYVDDIVEVENKTAQTTLKDTTTKARLVMDRDSLSTLATNENVELRIELNNANETSDIYGHSVFEIGLPEYVQSLEVTDASIVYGEGLDITSVEVIGKTIRVTLDGVQDGINSGVLTNGTNIELNANIKVDLYTPAKSEMITLNYTNDDATNYEDNGYSELEVSYSAPFGLVSVNSTSNYNNIGSTLTSVRQGSQEDLIDIYSEAKRATMEIIVMNNNSNKVSNVAILGRIPFKGVKNIENGEDLGTTVNTKLVSGIVSDEHNSTVFSIYYSENGEASKDLNDASNGWTMNPESLENIKSYLIVSQDSNYEMEQAEILRFTYEYEIPENLPHNEEIFGTFLAYYTNHSDVATTDEMSAPDKIGLSTGEGPELTIGISTDRETVKEYEELKVTATVNNVGEDTAKDIVVNMPIPTYASYSSLESENENIKGELNSDSLKINCNELEKNGSLQFTVIFVAKNLPTIEQYYKNIDGFMMLDDGTYVIRKYSKTEEEVADTDEVITYEDQVVENVPDINIEVKMSVTAKDLGTELVSETKKVALKEAEFYMAGYVIDEAILSGTQDIGTEIQMGLNVKNISRSSKSNTVITQVLPNELDFVSGEIKNEAGDKLADAKYDESTRTITWDAGAMDSGRYAKILYTVKVARLDEGMSEKELDMFAKVTADGTDTYTSNTVKLNVGKALLTISQSTLTADTYIKEGQTIVYVFSIKNEGSVRANGVSLVDEIPDGLIVRKISYIADGMTTTKRISSKDQASVDLTLLPGSEAVVTIEALASGLNGVQEKTVTNLATVVAQNTDKQETNSITHIIEADPAKSNSVVDESHSTINSSTDKNNNNIVKTYKITGLAWLDENRDGMRNGEEQLLPGISAKLINSETGVIVKSVTTDSNGAYTFAGVENGKYLVLFDYDTVKYTTTTYQKSDVATNVNSDAITTQIEQDGKVRNGAVTDVITVADGSISNVDIGLVLADTFDLKLDKTITKVTVQTRAGTTSKSYENETLAKTDIAAKYLSGSTVHVEYEITVTNVGDIAGYAKKIVDYIPEGMQFNSGFESNSNWYTGTDGNLYTTAFSDAEIVKGQSKTVKLVLTKQMTEENTGVINNQAEIYEDYNIYGITDKNSTPANKAQGENDLGTADVAVLVKTGEVFIYVSVIITTILLGSIVVFIAYNKIVLRKRKGGV